MNYPNTDNFKKIQGPGKSKNDFLSLQILEAKSDLC